MVRAVDPADLAAGLAADVAADVDRILTPREVLAAFAASGLPAETLGHDAGGEPIRAWRLGRGARATLWYGWPDPGEGVGGTALVALLRAWLRDPAALDPLDATLAVIPVLNLLDQPDGGRSTAPARKTAAQEVDWCVHDPRPETTALLALAAAVRPSHVFPLHDEWHCREPLPAYAVVEPALPDAVCAAVRAACARFGQPFDGGEGFVPMRAAPDYASSTFAAMAGAGAKVFICEVAEQPARPPRDWVAAQLAACFCVLAGG